MLTARGPRLAAGARTHLLGSAPCCSVIKAVGFWLDRYEACSSRRAGSSSARPTPTCSPRCRRCGGWPCSACCARPPAWPRSSGRGASWWARPRACWSSRGSSGSAPTPRCSSAFGSRPTSWRRAAVHRAQHPDHAAGLRARPDRGAGLPGRGEPRRAAALARNEPTIKNIRLWDHRPLLRTFGQLQEIRTYYKFVDVDNDRYMVNGEYRQVMLSAARALLPHLPSRGLDQRAPDLHPRLRRSWWGRSTASRPEGLPEFFVKDIPPGRPAAARRSRGRRSTTARSRTSTCSCGTRSQELDYPRGRPERLHDVRGRGAASRSTPSCGKAACSRSRFGAIKILLSDDLTPESRIMIYRTSASGCSGSRRSSGSTATPTWSSAPTGGWCGCSTATPRPTATRTPTRCAAWATTSATR